MTAGRVLADLAWPAVADGGILAVPVGSCEQHGPHLPLGTDTDVAVALAGGLALRRPGVSVAPPLAYGASGEHAGFPGTLSIGTDVLCAVVVELCRSADHFDGVVLVNGHGGNLDALTAATTLLGREGRRVLAWSPSPSAAAATGRAPDAHAGWVETSVLLALRPVAVRNDRAAAGVVAPLASLMGRLRTGGVRAVSPNGVLGDPTGADAATGRTLLDAWVDELTDAVAGWAR